MRIYRRCLYQLCNALQFANARVLIRQQFHDVGAPNAIYHNSASMIWKQVLENSDKKSLSVLINKMENSNTRMISYDNLETMILDSLARQHKVYMLTVK